MVRSGHRLGLALAALLILGLLTSPGRADAVSPVIVTISGEVEKPNRPPFDPAEDAFFAYHERAFQKAAKLDLESLLALPQVEVQSRYEKSPEPHRFEGPLLRDVLELVGADSASLRVTALDGYTSDIPVSDLDKYEVILALKRDGVLLEIGGYGPAWIIYPREDDAELQGEHTQSKQIWAVFLIEVQ